MKKIPYNTTEKYIGIDYKPNGKSKQEGFNCLSMMLDFCKEELDLDYEFDDKIVGDITWENVVDLFHANPKKVFAEVEKHLLSYGEKIPPHQMRKGDTLSVDCGDGIKIPCVYAGGNKVLLTTTEGVKVKSLKGIRVHDAYRIKESKKIITKAIYKMGEKAGDLKLVKEDSFLHDGDIAECEGAAEIIAIVGLIISLLTAIWVYFNQPEMDDPAPQSPRGLKINTRSTREPVRVVYGLQRVGGNDVYISTQGSHNNYLYVIQTVSEGEVYGIDYTGEALANNVTGITQADPGVVSSVAHGLSVGDRVHFSGLNEMTELNNQTKTVTVIDTANTFSIDDCSGHSAAETTGGACGSVATEEILIDDKAYTDFGSTIRYEFYPGSSTQSYDTILNAADANWTDNLRYTSYIAWRFTWDENNYRGIPDRVIDLKGRIVEDFRDDSSAWSDNVVLCLYDFMTNGRYGLGVATTDIDETSWTTAANYIDTKGWSFNYVTGNNANPWNIVQDMLQHFRASISWFDGEYYLLVADINDESSVMTITDAHIVQDGSGKAQITIIQPSRFVKPKGIRVSYRDKEKHYVQDTVLIGNETGVVESMSLMGYTDRETVCNLATYRLERLKLNRTITGTFRDDCLELAPHDLVTFTSTALGISSQAMRVVSTTFQENGLINLTLQYEAAALYDDDYDVDIEGVYTCSLPDPNTEVIISNPSIAEETFYYGLRTESRLNITFTVADTEPWFKHCEVWQATTAQGAAVPVESDYEHQYNTTSDFNIDHVEQGRTYYIVLVTVTIYGVKQTFNNAFKLSKTVTGDSDAPTSLAALSAIPSAGGVTLFGTKLTDPDIEIYEFRLGAQWTGGIFLSAKRSPQESFPGCKPGSHTFFCNTKSTSGEYGATPRSATATVSLPLGWSLANTFTDDYDGTALPNNITGITKADPGVVSSVAHTLIVGDKVAFSGLTEMTELNGTTQTVTVIDSADTFSINDTSGYGVAETTGGACGTEVGTHDNTEKTTHAAANYLMCSHTASVLTGTYISKHYDTGGVADDYYIYVEADVVITGSGTTWDDVLPNEALTNNVTGITKADPGVVSSVAHGLSVDDTVYFSGLTEMTELNGTFQYVTVEDSADTFSINDTSGYGAAETTGGACCSKAPTWDEINIDTRTWNEIFSVDEAPQVTMTILYKTLIGDAWSEMPHAEILSATVNARYFAVKIEITDPSDAIYAKVENLSLKVYSET